jgi:uncharacterized protein (DUF697 family)
MIPYAMSYNSTVRGRAVKQVTCEGCRLEYVYMVERTGSGEGTSVLFLDNEGAAGRAEQAAVREVEQKLAEAVDVVPCPGCGRVQLHMFARAARDRYGWCTTAAVAAVVVAVIAGVVAAVGTTAQMSDRTLTVVGGVAGAAVLTAVLLLVYAARGRAQFDPNDWPAEQRFQLAADRAVTKEQFGRMLAEAAAAGPATE